MEIGKKIRQSGKLLMTRAKSGLKNFTQLVYSKSDMVMISNDTYLAGGGNTYIRYVGPDTFRFIISIANGQTYTLPMLGNLTFNTLSNDIIVDWGEGTEETVFQEGRTITAQDLRHTYSLLPSSGDEQVTITITATRGVIPHFKADNRIVKVLDPLPSFDPYTAYYTSAKEMFGVVSLTEIPSNLFKNNPQITDFSQCFRFTKITELPQGVLDYSKNNIINCLDLVKDNTYLTTIPSDLFSKVKPSCLTSAFEGCSNLSTYIDASTFFGDLSHCDNSADWRGIERMFKGCSLSTGDADAFVNVVGNSSFNAYHNGALNGCSLWDGWASIDSSWK